MIIRKFFIHNWPAIFYLNFKMLPFHKAIHLPIDIYGKVRFEKLTGRLSLNGRVLRAGMIKIGSQGSDMFPNSNCVVSIEGTVEITDTLIVGTGSSFISKKGSKIRFGSNAIFGARNIIFCEQEMNFGDDFLTSWDCQIMDTDTHDVVDCITSEFRPSVKPVSFGEHVWLGNGVIVNKGTKLPSNTIVASRSLCNKDYTDIGEYSILAGSPAKVVAKNKRWRL